MAPILHKGDMIVINNNSTTFENAKIGDIIIFKALDPAEDNKTIVSRIVTIFQRGTDEQEMVHSIIYENQ
jgi:signal peptidase I